MRAIIENMTSPDYVFINPEFFFSGREGGNDFFRILDFLNLWTNWEITSYNLQSRRKKNLRREGYILYKPKKETFFFVM